MTDSCFIVLTLLLWEYELQHTVKHDLVVREIVCILIISLGTGALLGNRDL